MFSGNDLGNMEVSVWGCIFFAGIGVATAIAGVIYLICWLYNHIVII